MKRISLVLFILIISCLITVSFATEENTLGNEQTENVINTFGKIVEASAAKDVENGYGIDKVQQIVVQITEGDYKGEEFTTEYVLSYDLEGKMLAYELDVGDKVEVQITEDLSGNVTATVMEISRINHILAICIIFIISVVLICGKKGIRTTIGLLFTLIITYLFMIKQIYNGSNAILISIISSFIIIIGTFVIINGINRKTLSATIGTFGGVITAGVIALIFNYFSKMTGSYQDAVSLSVNLSLVKFNFRDLLFAGLMISTLGACMDIGLSIASGLEEQKLKESEISWKELFKKGISIGRENISTMANTLILAYIGSSLTLVLLFMTSDMRFVEIINKERIAEYIMLAIIGSMGVVYTIPITSIIYSLLNKDKIIYKRVAESKLDGKRSLKL